jgi:transcriptional regulator with XRE-family HTH domain
MNNKEFNNRIKELREKKGLSQDELASLSGLSLRTIQRIEKNATNPLGDTKRKILQILESHPNTDFSNEPKTVEKNDCLKTIVIKYQYPLTIYVFSLLLISIGLSGLKGFLFLGFTIGFLSLIILTISTVYHLRTRKFKSGIKYLTFYVSSVLIYIFIVSWFIPSKYVQSTTINGVTTRIERNVIAGKSDTIIIEENNNINND